MLPPAVALVAWLALLGALLWWAPSRLSGPPWARQALLASVVLVFVGAFGGWAVPRYGPEAADPWEAGELRADGLRLEPSGRADAAEVLDPASFAEGSRAREVYGIAAEIPELLNQLYCWCGCIEHGRHRSALACFEDSSATSCGVCQETARIAWEQVQDGVADPARIQRAVDREWAPADVQGDLGRRPVGRSSPGSSSP